MKIKRILVPVDFSELSKQALQVADDMAVEKGAELHVLHVYEIVQVSIMDFNYVDPPEKIAQVAQAAEKELANWTAQLKTPQERLRKQVVTGSPVREISNASANADLIVMGTHGRSGVSHFLMGSVAERVVQAAKCSVLVVKPAGK